MVLMLGLLSFMYWVAAEFSYCDFGDCGFAEVVLVGWFGGLVELCCQVLNLEV